MSKQTRLVWVDMEMTGLDPETDRVIEIATIVTTQDLEVLAEGPVIALRQSEAAIAAMDEWNTRTHTQSGLVDRIRSSTIDEAEASARRVASKAAAGAGNIVTVLGKPAREAYARLLATQKDLVLPLDLPAHLLHLSMPSWQVP